MGLIRAAVGAIGGTLGEQWLEALTADRMDQQTVCTGAVRPREDARDSNRRGTSAIISNGSRIQVNPNQFMLLVDGGKIVDFTAEPGYYTVNNSSSPSLFAGGFGASIRHSWDRFKFGGANPQQQKAYFINLQEIKGIKFGTPNALNYFDNFYNAELFVRAFGTYSIRVTDPILFFAEALPRDQERVQIDDINEQYLSEFLGALQTSINQLSVDGIRVSHLGSRSMELSKVMSDVLDNDWKQQRGFMIQNVGIANISYDDESREIIRTRSQGAMLQDPNIREGFVQGAVARGLESAGKNEAGAGAAFMGMGFGMNAGGGFMSGSSQSNLEQMHMQQQAAAQGQPQRPGPAAGGFYGGPQAEARPAAAQPQQGGSWPCPQCQTPNPGNAKFCGNCGTARPAQAPPQKAPRAAFCGNCGAKLPEEGKFCPSCGRPIA